jgi:DsbC/DsbD-like thiol-disulfide interchange protein
VKALIVPAFCLLALGCPAQAEEAAMSSWSSGSHSQLRLIAGPTTPTGKQRVGVEIKMTPGYKTYWRSPGDSGVPPVFDWSGSDNVGGLDVRWPAPQRFEAGNGYGVGYIDEVVVPISVQPVDPDKPVTVVLKLAYAVCEKICIPATGEARLWLKPGVTAVTSPRLEEYEARVPVPVRHGQPGDQIAILDMRKNERMLELGLRAPAEGAIEDVFVEGPGAWAFGRPVLTPQADGSTLARIKITERPRGAGGPTPFIVTVSGKPQAVEARLELDIGTARP